MNLYCLWGFLASCILLLAMWILKFAGAHESCNLQIASCILLCILHLTPLQLSYCILDQACNLNVHLAPLHLAPLHFSFCNLQIEFCILHSILHFAPLHFAYWTLASDNLHLVTYILKFADCIFILASCNLCFLHYNCLIWLAASCMPCAGIISHL